MKHVAGVSLLSFTVIVSSRSIHACTEPLGPPPVWIVPGELMGGLPGEYWVILHNFTTFGSQPGTFCSCGLSVQRVLSGFIVEQLETLDASTQLPIAGFDFKPNASTAAGFDSLCRRESGRDAAPEACVLGEEHLTLAPHPEAFEYAVRAEDARGRPRRRPEQVDALEVTARGCGRILSRPFFFRWQGSQYTPSVPPPEIRS